MLIPAAGSCDKGLLCHGAHTVRELRVVAAIEQGKLAPQYKTEICPDWPGCHAGGWGPACTTYRERPQALKGVGWSGPSSEAFKGDVQDVLFTNGGPDLRCQAWPCHPCGAGYPRPVDGGGPTGWTWASTLACAEDASSARAPHTAPRLHWARSPGGRAAPQLEGGHASAELPLTLRGRECTNLPVQAAALPLFFIVNSLCRGGLLKVTPELHASLPSIIPPECRPALPSPLPCISELRGQGPHVHLPSPPAGLECHMAHGFEEVRREAAVMAGTHDDNYKTRLCMGFTFKHRCTKGSRCKDAHGAADLRWVPRACMCSVMLQAACRCDIAYGRWPWPCLFMGQPLPGKGNGSAKQRSLPQAPSCLVYCTAQRESAHSSHMVNDLSDSELQGWVLRYDKRTCWLQ